MWMELSEVRPIRKSAVTYAFFLAARKGCLFLCFFGARDQTGLCPSKYKKHSLIIIACFLSWYRMTVGRISFCCLSKISPFQISSCPLYLEVGYAVHAYKSTVINIMRFTLVLGQSILFVLVLILIGETWRVPRDPFFLSPSIVTEPTVS